MTKAEQEQYEARSKKLQDEADAWMNRWTTAVNDPELVNSVCDEILKRVAEVLMERARSQPGPIARFRKTYPEVRFVLSRKERPAIIEAVLAGEVHLGISAPQKPHPSLDYQVIEKHDRVLVAPKGHPLASNKRITPEQIAKYPLLLPPSGTCPL